MKFINTKLHGRLDYLVSALLIAAPWLFGFAEGGAETWIFVGQGIFVILYSLFTDYEFGLIRVLDMRVHLGLDLAGAILMIFSPWLFGFALHGYSMHIYFGVLELLLISFSQRVPKDREIPVKHSRPFPFRSAALHKQLR